CPPYSLRREYAGRLPDRIPKTPELLIYPHLWDRRNHPGVTGGAPAAGPAPRADPPDAGDATQCADAAQRAARTPPDDDAPGNGATADDIAQLNRLVEALLLA